MPPPGEMPHFLGKTKYIASLLIPNDAVFLGFFNSFYFRTSIDRVTIFLLHHMHSICIMLHVFIPKMVDFKVPCLHANFIFPIKLQLTVKWLNFQFLSNLTTWCKIVYFFLFRRLMLLFILPLTHIYSPDTRINKLFIDLTKVVGSTAN